MKNVKNFYNSMHRITNQELFMLIYTIIWAVVSNGLWLITNDVKVPVLIVNPIFIVFFIIFYVIKYKSKRFYNWLEKPLRGNKD